jgi:predicted methyltransferase
MAGRGVEPHGSTGATQAEAKAGSVSRFLEGIAQELVRADGQFATPRDVARVLSVLQSTASFWDLAQRSNVPLLALCGLVRRLAEAGLVEIHRDRIELTDSGVRFCQTGAIAPHRLWRCPQCLGRGIDLGPVESIREKFAEIAAERPPAIQEYDQGYLVEEATLAKVAFLWSKGDLEERELLILGDDDLVSIAASLTGAPKRVVVLEVDPRLVQFIRNVSEAFALDIETALYDVRQPLPDEYVQAFDTFVTDPSESVEGFKAFVTRGLLGLKGPGGAGAIGLSWHEASAAKWRQLELWLLEVGCVLTDLRSEFGLYQNWPYLEHMRSWKHLPVRIVPERPWYQSSLFRVELLQRVQLENQRFPDHIFEDSEAATF